MKHTFYLLSLACLLSCSAAKRASVNEKHQPGAMIITDYGTMVIKLYNTTPLHRDNFVRLVKKHFFDSLLFHRVIKDFMIQGGDPDSKHARQGELLGEGSLKYTIPGEFNTALSQKRSISCSKGTRC